MFDAQPDAFGSYRVLETLGAGRFGSVFRAADNERVVAIKVFDQDLTEAQASVLGAVLQRLSEAPLDHPSIVPVVAAGVIGDKAWFAEPWVDATSLDSILRGAGPQALGDVLMRITQIAGALDFASAVGIHHGAFHPHDVLVSDERTSLTGIGLVEALSDAGLDVPMEGAYVSPQRALGLPVTARDDIYALAAITFELVYGTEVPEASALHARMTQLTGVDQSRFEDVLRGALSKEPGDRPSTALEFAAALQQVLVENAYAPDLAPIADTAIMVPAPDPVPAALADVDDFSFRAREPEPVLVSTEPAFDIPAPVSIEPEPAVQPSNLFSIAAQPRRDDRERVEESRRLSQWFAIAASLAIGVLTGFAGGFVVGQRDTTPTPVSAERAVPRAQRSGPAEDKPGSTAGQEFSESNVPAQPVVDEPVIPPSQAKPSTPTPTRQSVPASQAEPRRRNVTTESSRNAALSKTAARGPGALEVDSRPRGARVFIDGTLVGKTPLSLPDVQPGSHAVRIDMVGYRRWVTAISVAPGSRQRVAASLEK